MRFTATIKILGVNPYVLVGAPRAKAFMPGWKKPLPVLVRVNGKPDAPWRINLMPVGDGSFYLYLHGNVRKPSGTKVGDRVGVEIEFDRDEELGRADAEPAEGNRPLSGESEIARGSRPQFEQDPAHARRRQGVPRGAKLEFFVRKSKRRRHNGRGTKTEQPRDAPALRLM